MELLIGLAFFWICLIVLGIYVAEQKGRDGGEALLLTVFFGPFGVLIIVLLPTIAKTPSSPAPDPLAQREAYRHFRESQDRIAQAKKAAHEAEVARKREVAAKRREETHKRWASKGIRPGPLAPIEEFGIATSDWYRSLGDLGQAVVLGLAFAIPAGSILFAVMKSRSVPSGPPRIESPKLDPKPATPPDSPPSF